MFSRPFCVGHECTSEVLQCLVLLPRGRGCGLLHTAVDRGEQLVQPTILRARMLVKVLKGPGNGSNCDSPRVAISGVVADVVPIQKVVSCGGRPIVGVGCPGDSWKQQ